MADSSGISLNVLKSILLVTLWFLTFICCLAPLGLRKAALSSHMEARQRTYMYLFSVSSCFGGGVFLATCLLDLFPDTVSEVNNGIKLLQANLNNFPLAEFFVALGFFVILMMEQLVLWWKENKQEQEISEPEVAQPVAGDERRASMAGAIIQTPLEGRLEGISNKVTARVPRNSGVSGEHDFATRSFRAEDVEPLTARDGLGDSGSFGHGHSHSISGRDLLSTDESVSVHFNPESHSSTLRAVLLVAALSLHTLFEGMALGLAPDSANAIQLFGALCIHKSVIGFSLGLRLVQSKLIPKAVVLCCLIFSSVMAFGAVLGILIESAERHSAAGSLTNGALQGVACGTFLYVTFFEVLPHELNPRGHRIGKLLMLLCGFTVMCVFILLYPSAD